MKGHSTMLHNKLVSTTIIILAIFALTIAFADDDDDDDSGKVPMPTPELPATELRTLFDGDILSGELEEIGPFDIEEFSQFSFLGTSNRGLFVEFIFTTASGDMLESGRCTFGNMTTAKAGSWGIGIISCKFATAGGAETFLNDGVFQVAGPLLKIRIKNVSGADAVVTLKAFLRR